MRQAASAPARVRRGGRDRVLVYTRSFDGQRVLVLANLFHWLAIPALEAEAAA